jgi:hypothetical protein
MANVNVFQLIAAFLVFVAFCFGFGFLAISQKLSSISFSISYSINFLYFYNSLALYTVKLIKRQLLQKTFTVTPVCRINSTLQVGQWPPSFSHLQKLQLLTCLYLDLVIRILAMKSEP